MPLLCLSYDYFISIIIIIIAIITPLLSTFCHYYFMTLCHYCFAIHYFRHHYHDYAILIRFIALFISIRH